MADAEARRAAIKQAAYHVRNGGAFVRRATTTQVTSTKQSASKPSASRSTPHEQLQVRADVRLA